MPKSLQENIKAVNMAKHDLRVAILRFNLSGMATKVGDFEILCRQRRTGFWVWCARGVYLWLSRARHRRLAISLGLFVLGVASESRGEGGRSGEGESTALRTGNLDSPRAGTAKHCESEELVGVSIQRHGKKT